MIELHANGWEKKSINAKKKYIEDHKQSIQSLESALVTHVILQLFSANEFNRIRAR